MLKEEETEKSRAFLRAWTYVLGGLSFVAFYVTRGKVGPQEFFPVVTAWRDVSPLTTAVGVMGLLAALVGACLVTSRAGERLSYGRIMLGACAFPLTLVVIAVLPNAPLWFVTAFFRTTAVGTVLLALAGVRRRNAPAKNDL